MSDIDIADDAASLISLNDAVLNATGVDHIRVDGGIGEGGYGVNAADGAVLTSFSAEIDFDVVDTAQAIAAEVTGTDIRDGSSNSASDLDDAGHIFITGGSVNVADANVIQVFQDMMMGFIIQALIMKSKIRHKYYKLK